jgi:hypothetical protein
MPHSACPMGAGLGLAKGAIDLPNSDVKVGLVCYGVVEEGEEFLATHRTVRSITKGEARMLIWP